MSRSNMKPLLEAIGAASPTHVLVFIEYHCDYSSTIHGIYTEDREQQARDDMETVRAEARKRNDETDNLDILRTPLNTLGADDLSKSILQT